MNALFSHHSSLPGNYITLKRKVHEACDFYSKKIKEEAADLFNTLFDNHVAYENVFLLLKALMGKVFPKNFLGDANMKVLNLSIVYLSQMFLISNYRIEKVCRNEEI